MEREANLCATETKKIGFPKPEIPLHSIEELDDQTDDSHALLDILSVAEYSKLANDEPKQEILMLPVSGEFVTVNVDKVGKSEFHNNPVEPLDRCILAVTNIAKV